MGQENYYRYFKSDTETKTKLGERYNAEIASMRDAVFEKLQKDTGCIAWQERKNWGEPNTIMRLAYPQDHEYAVSKHMMVEHTNFDGVPVISVRGKNNCKAGKEFNDVIMQTNKTLKQFPAYRDWIVDQLGIRLAGLGGPSGRGFGVAMISTYGGTSGDVLAFAIPKDGFERLTIPDCLTEISYGVFYDMTHS